METRVEIGDLFVLTLHVLEPQRQRRLLLCTFADLKKPLSSDGFRDRPFYHDRVYLCGQLDSHYYKYCEWRGFPHRSMCSFRDIIWH